MLAEVDRLADKVLTEAGLTAADVRAVGVGVPGPVDFAAGRPSHPPIMPGWHDHPIPEAFGRFDCPVYVDNDVNVMALGEMGVGGSTLDVLVVKVGTGIGCGVIVNGRVYRGATGSAGDIGHIQATPPTDGWCSATAAWRTAWRPSPVAGRCCATPLAGPDVSTTREVVELAAQGSGPALELVRDAGRTIGRVLASLVNFFNPHRIVMTGGVAQAGAPLLAGIREAVYGRTLPLAARALDITVSARRTSPAGSAPPSWRSRGSSTRTPCTRLAGRRLEPPDRPLTAVRTAGPPARGAVRRPAVLRFGNPGGRP